jgi:hypothetical protein
MRTDNIKIIEEILVKIESQLDEKNIDWSKFNADALCMTKPRWCRLMTMLNDGGIIKGFSYSGEADNPNVDIKNISLTFKGLEIVEKAKNGKFEVSALL